MRFKKKNCNKQTVILLVIMIVLFILISPLETYSATDEQLKIDTQLTETIIDELKEIDFSELTLFANQFETNKTNIFSLDNIKNKVYSIISGENAVSYQSFIASVFSIIIDLVIRYLPMLSLIIAIGVISNLLNGIKSKFNEKSTGNLVHLVCFLTVSILMISMIMNLSKTTNSSITNMVSQTNVLFPILMTLMVGLGATASVGVFQPIVAIMSTYVADIFSYIIMPLFLLSFTFGVISNLSSNIKLDKFNSFFAGLFKWAVGITFTIFFAIMAVQGISAGSFDSVSIRTTKYTIKSYVPVMGGYLSDGMDLILASSVLIKNSVGLVGILMIITTILAPILEIVIFSLVLKLISAILQPMGNDKITNFLSSTSKSVIMLSTSIIAIGFMYLISIGLVMTTANVVM